MVREGEDVKRLVDNCTTPYGSPLAVWLLKCKPQTSRKNAEVEPTRWHDIAKIRESILWFESPALPIYSKSGRSTLTVHVYLREHVKRIEHRRLCRKPSLVVVTPTHPHLLRSIHPHG
jgi:hypothetical protein